MIKRIIRALPSLSKSVSKVSVIGDNSQPGEPCFGYFLGDDGLELCPAPGENAVTHLTANELYSVDRHSILGITLLLYTNGLSVIFSKEQLQSILIELPAGQPFSVEARNESGHMLIGVVSANKLGVYNCYNGETDIYNLPSTLCGGIVHCGRLFAVDRLKNSKVVWSGLRIYDWEDGIDGSGYILLDGDVGEVQKLENFGDDILCVRDYGFTVIKALADSRNFRIAPSQSTVKTGRKINVGGVSGQRYYFSTDVGLYSFDGVSVKIEYSVGGSLSAIGRVYVLDDGYVYADCVYNGTQCIMRYDLQSGKAVFFAQGCSFPFIHKGETYCVKDGGFFALSPTNAESGRIWRSKAIGGCGKKTLKNLYVDCDGTPELTVISGDVRRKLSGTGRIPVNLAGERIYVEISGNAPVKSVVAELEARK